MPKEKVHTHLLFFPPKVQSMAESLAAAAPSTLLLQKDLNTPDWSLEHLWNISAYFHLGMRFERAMPYYQKLLEWTRNNSHAQSEVLASVGHIFLLSQLFTDARNVLKTAVQLDPKNAAAHYYLSECLLKDHQVGAALESLTTFLEFYPHNDLLLARAGRLVAGLQDQVGKPLEARKTFQKLAERLNSWAFELQAQTYIPPLPLDQGEPASVYEHLSSAHSQFYDEEFLSLFIFRLLSRRTAEIRSELEHLGEFIAPKISRYLGLDGALKVEKPIKNQSVAILGDFCDPKAEPYLDAIIALARDRSITIICTADVPDLFKQEEWMRIYPCSNNLEHMFNAVKSYDPDLLVYLASGQKQPNLFLLASQQLAPVQAVLGTESLTSGLQTLQYYLSLDFLEPEEADQHYTERLIRLKGTPLSNISLPDLFIEPNAFNLPQNQNIYLCPVKLSDLHQEMYALFASILQANPEGLIFILSSGNESLDDRFQKFFDSNFPDYSPRLQVLRPMPEYTLLSLMRCVDLVLDPIYQGIQEKSWQYILLGTPILTCSGDYASGRYISSLYKQIALDDSIAKDPSDYVLKAIELVKNRAFKAGFSQHVERQRKRLFKYQDYIHDLGAFVDQTLQRD